MEGHGRFSGPRPFKPSPVRVGEEYDVKIESMSKRGDSGVARVQGLVIFVAGTKAGESTRIRITKVGRGYATAEVAGQGTETAGAEEGHTHAATTGGEEQDGADIDTEAGQQEGEEIS